MLRSARLKSGFSLIELMVVVGIVGLLASIAVPAFLEYMARAKEAEISLNLSEIVNGQAVFYTTPRISATGTDLQPCILLSMTGAPAGGSNSRPRPWVGSPNFDTIGFHPSGSVYATYATAIGLDGIAPDGTPNFIFNIVAGGFALCYGAPQQVTAAPQPGAYMADILAVSNVRENGTAHVFNVGFITGSPNPLVPDFIPMTESLVPINVNPPPT